MDFLLNQKLNDPQLTRTPQWAVHQSLITLITDFTTDKNFTLMSLSYNMLPITELLINLNDKAACVFTCVCPRG